MCVCSSYERQSYVSTSVSAGSRYQALLGANLLLLDLGVNPSFGFNHLVSNSRKRCYSKTNASNPL
jgi:hypothetical protein